ncbi:MAG: hypothetical protein GXO75_09000 [Calditrichaeota bacterium]|nr:hypothetical protein [Calditrichota bacterium]
MQDNKKTDYFFAIIGLLSCSLVEQILTNVSLSEAARERIRRNLGQEKNNYITKSSS